MATNSHSGMKPLEAFWCDPIPPYSLAAFRILFGLYLLIYFLGFFPMVTLIFSNQGVYIPFLMPDVAPDPPLAWLLYGLTLMLILLFTLGWKTRWVTPLLLVAYLYHYLLIIAESRSSYDRLIVVTLAILCFADQDKAWSFQHRQQNTDTRLITAWPLRLLTLQFSLFYVGTGISKLFYPAWHTGQLLEWTLCGPWGTSFGFWLMGLQLPYWFFDVAVWSIILFESAFGVLLFDRRRHYYLFPLGVVFHLSIWLLMNIPQFMLCPCAYVLYMDPKRLWQKTARLFQNYHDTAPTIKST